MRNPAGAHDLVQPVFLRVLRDVLRDDDRINCVGVPRRRATLSTTIALCLDIAGSSLGWARLISSTATTLRG